ncbi:MAG: PIN domain-containing protein [Candidatus Daviesbacteria bacterium]|nr:PIN domain-containing protein [Candidatus Daviesbacteria bacterium]
MAKVFLDTNYFIDAIHRKPERQILDSLEGHIICISPLSLHIYCYTYKIKIPNKKVASQKEKFQLIDFSKIVVERSLDGPTTDFEDNVQLNSAAEAECDLFLTNDKKLLNLKFFGKTKIVDIL